MSQGSQGPAWEPVSFSQKCAAAGGQARVKILLDRNIDSFLMSFRNKYTAAISIRFRSDGVWTTCLRDHLLMPSAHLEDGGQDLHLISSQTVRVKYV
jgi:hypothetical protein